MPTGAGNGRDKFHVLPTPQPVIDPLKRPLVGNLSVDDNLTESVQIAIWTAIGEAEHALAIAVENGVLTLSGSFTGQRQRLAAKRAARSVAGIREIVDHASMPSKHMPKPRRVFRSAAATIIAREEAAASPLLSVVRYCGVDEASTSAAIRQAIEVLDAYLVARELSAPETLVILYRNRMPATVTLEVGYPLEQALSGESEEMHFGATPAGKTLSMLVDKPDIEGVLAAYDRLLSRAKSAGLSPLPFCWQVFRSDQFRPWQGHPNAPVKITLKAARRPMKRSGTYSTQSFHAAEIRP